MRELGDGINVDNWSLANMGDAKAVGSVRQILDMLGQRSDALPDEPGPRLDSFGESYRMLETFHLEAPASCLLEILADREILLH